MSNPTGEAVDKLRDIPDDTDDGEIFAAVDLGSNSFHLIVARYAQGQLVVIDRLREMVQLRAGLTTKNLLDDEVQLRALDCLSRFGERLRGVDAAHLRVVGTNTLRNIHDGGAFLRAASHALGHSIDVISGIEEARLVYLGALTSLPALEEKTLVVDIGGGSTELIVGHDGKPLVLESLEMGCVSYSKIYFPNGKVSRWRFRRAQLAARQELRAVAPLFLKHKWADAIGTSGTARAIAAALLERDGSVTGISRSGMKDLMRELIGLGNTQEFAIAGISEERANVFAGGLAIMLEVFKRLDIEEMNVAEGALREGILHDLVGRYGNEDARESTVRAMCLRYHVDEAQAGRVADSAQNLLDQVENQLGLNGDYRKLLRWAAELHEIGLDIAHSRYHHHGAYLLQHSDMPGFSKREQLILSALVGQHRRKIKANKIEAVPEEDRAVTIWLIVLLRLAVLLNRSRSGEAPPQVTINAKNGKLTLSYPSGWLKENPLSRADLSDERKYLKALVRLSVKASA